MLGIKVSGKHSYIKSHKKHSLGAGNKKKKKKAFSTLTGFVFKLISVF